ncbi:MAG: outer membrane beta-barrel protein [bacterium]
MRQSLTVVPLVLCLSILVSSEATAANRAGAYNLAANLGFADTRSDNSYRQDQTLSFAFEYQKTGYAAYRATAGFLTVEGREPVSTLAGTRDADALFVTGNFVVTPRFAVVHPFLTAGIGIYSVRLTDNLDSSHQVELGANWGFGMDVQLLRYFYLRGEVQFHYTTGDISSPLQTLTLGGRFTFD